MELIYQYLLFFAKSITVVVAIMVVFIFVMTQRKKTAVTGLVVKDLTEDYRNLKEKMLTAALDDTELKAYDKQQKQEAKKKKQAKKRSLAAGEEVANDKSTLFVIAFKGSADAHEVESLRKEITAVLSAAKSGDEVLLNLESPGGVVHGYGLAASQLLRLREKSIPLTAVVDKVAASGGYMMACVANKIIAAPFAIVGSIGVVAQVPNVHRLLKKNDIDVELHTAGQYKRTLTLLGENTEEGRQKFKEELNETHDLFKAFVHDNRPSLDIEHVATGEHWYGQQAQSLGLIDEISTSDDVILSKLETHKIYRVKYVQKKKIAERVSGGVMNVIEQRLANWLYKSNKTLM